MPSKIEAKVVAASTRDCEHHIHTLQLKYPRFIHGEFLTHRAFERNSSSSRAIPVRKLLAQVWSDPAMPIHWGQNQPGMQAKSQLAGFKLWAVKRIWRTTGKVACVFAWTLMKLSLHKQIANRVLEPWQWMHTVVTATDWDNFFELRIHPDAQPEIKELAERMKEAIDTCNIQVLTDGEWHLPYVLHTERRLPLETRKQISAARTARVSYLTHDGKHPDIEQDVALFQRLAGSRPRHYSPLGHQARPAEGRHANLNGWKSFRREIEEGGQACN